MPAKKVTIPIAILTIIAGVAGGSYAFDFSNTITTITETNVDQSGDEQNWITNLIPDGVGEEAFMASQCYKDPISPEYAKACIDWLED